MSTAAPAGDAETLSRSAHKLGVAEAALAEARNEAEAALQAALRHADELAAMPSLLRDLPRSLTVDTMIPLCDVAFIPGKLIRTNEVLVTLGDGYHAMRSAEQAAEIAERRLETAHKAVQQRRKELAEVGTKMDAAAELREGMAAFTGEDGMVEIREKVDEVPVRKAKRTMTEEEAEASAAKYAARAREIGARMAAERERAAASSASKSAEGDVGDEDPELTAMLDMLAELEEAEAAAAADGSLEEVDGATAAASAPTSTAPVDLSSRSDDRVPEADVVERVEEVERLRRVGIATTAPDGEVPTADMADMEMAEWMDKQWRLVDSLLDGNDDGAIEDGASRIRFDADSASAGGIGMPGGMKKLAAADDVVGGGDVIEVVGDVAARAEALAEKRRKKKKKKAKASGLKSGFLLSSSPKKKKKSKPKTKKAKAATATTAAKPSAHKKLLPKAIRRKAAKERPAGGATEKAVRFVSEVVAEEEADAAAVARRKKREGVERGGEGDTRKKKVGEGSAAPAWSGEVFERKSALERAPPRAPSAPSFPSAKPRRSRFMRRRMGEEDDD